MQVFSERVLVGELLEARDEVAGLADRERCVEPVLEGSESDLGQAASLGRGEVVVRELRQWFAAPEQESLVEKPACRLGITAREKLPRLRAEGLESVGVDLAYTGPKRIPARMRDEDPALFVVAEQLPQLRHVHADDLRGRPRRVSRPERSRNGVQRDDLVAPNEQDCE